MNDDKSGPNPSNLANFHERAQLAKGCIISHLRGFKGSIWDGGGGGAISGIIFY